MGIFLRCAGCHKLWFDVFFVNTRVKRDCEQILGVMPEPKTGPEIVVFSKLSNGDLYNF
jgi:hypothetical protein